MFRKLKQKIELDGGAVKTSPVKVSQQLQTGDEYVEASDKKLSDDNSSLHPQPQDDISKTQISNDVSTHTSNKLSITETPKSEHRVKINNELTSISSPVTDADTHSTDLAATPNSDLDLTEPRSRRQNLATTVLRYGEEISVKNKLISELEQRITELSTSGSRADSLRTTHNPDGGDTDTRDDDQLELIQGQLIECQRCNGQLDCRLKDQEKTITHLEKTIVRLEATDESNTGIISKLETQLLSKQSELDKLKLQCENLSDNLREQETLVQSLLSQAEKNSSYIEEKELIISQLQQTMSTTESSTTATAPAAPAAPADTIEISDRQQTYRQTDSSELKTKLQRAHSHSKQLEKQLEDKSTQLLNLLQENKQIKTNLENNKQQSVDELLSVSEEESQLRQQLSSYITKLSTLEAQHKTQSRLLNEKHKLMSNLEATLEKQLNNTKKDKDSLISNYTQQVTELQKRCDSLKHSLDSESQGHKRVKEELDSLREEALDKQLDDEKQLTDLHEQLSGLRGEVRQLERSKKKEIDLIQLELTNRDKRIAKIESELSSNREQSLTQIRQLRDEKSELESKSSEMSKSLSETENRLRSVDSERDELYLRNADLSSKFEKAKMELKSVQADYEQEKTTHLSAIHSNEISERNSQEKFEALEEKLSLLEEQVTVSQLQAEELRQAQTNIEELKHELSNQERTIAEKSKSLKMQQQTISDLKKTIKRELKGHDPSQGQVTEVSRGHDSMDRVRSSPALSELDRYDSPVEDNTTHSEGASHLHNNRVPPTSPHSGNPSLYRHGSTSAQLSNSTSSTLTQQYRHEVNGFCGHKDINFEYLKNVVFSFLVSKDRECIHLVKALAVILEFTKAEEKLLKETLQWKMSWWPAAKKPSQKGGRKS